MDLTPPTLRATRLFIFRDCRIWLVGTLWWSLLISGAVRDNQVQVHMKTILWALTFVCLDYHWIFFTDIWYFLTLFVFTDIWDFFTLIIRNLSGTASLTSNPWWVNLEKNYDQLSYKSHQKICCELFFLLKKGLFAICLIILPR